MVNRNSNLPTNTSSMQKIFNRNTNLGEKNLPESLDIQISRDVDSSQCIPFSTNKIPEQGVPLQTINFENMVGYKNRARNNLRKE